MSNNLLVFIISMVLALILTPVSIKLANQYKIVDSPRDGRRMHSRTIPSLGGMAICIAVCLTLIVFCFKYNSMPAIIIGGLIIFALGVVDDKLSLPAYVKFLVELVVAILMYAMGLRIQFIHNYFGEGTLSFSTAADFLITVLWIVGVTNAINLIDGLDGLAAGTVLINSLCLAYIISNDGQVMGRVAATMGFFALAGACLGFLPFNFSPAKTFMGDSGALFLGFMIATLSTVGRLKASTAITMLVPLFVLALPLFDTAFAIFRRAFMGTSIMGADKQHLHHVLMASGYGHKRAVIMLYGLSAIMAVAAIMLSKDFKIEAWILFGVACLYIYVFLTDPSRTSEATQPRSDIKNKRKSSEETKGSNSNSAVDTRKLF